MSTSQQKETPLVPAKELTIQETGSLLKLREQDVLLLTAQLKVARLRIVQLEATNRMIMLVCLAFALSCAKLVFDIQHTSSISQQRSFSHEVDTHKEEEVCDLIVHYDTQFGAGVYAGRDFHTKEIFQEMTGRSISISIVDDTYHLSLTLLLQSLHQVFQENSLIWKVPYTMILVRVTTIPTDPLH